MSLLLPQPPSLFLQPSLPSSPSSNPSPRNPKISSIHFPTPKPFPSKHQTSLHLTNSQSVGQFNLQQDWLHLLQTSIELKDLSLGLSIHAFLIKSARVLNTFHGNNLINMYSKFFEVESAHQVFDEMPIRNTISWTSLINGYSSINDFDNVFITLRKMHESGEKFNEHTCSCILHSVEDLRIGEQVHALATKIGVENNIAVGTSLVSMYASNGRIEEMEFLFREMVDIDIRCLNSLILDYKKNKNWVKVILTFIYVLETGLQPNQYTFTNTISACDGSISINEGRQIHGLAIKCGALCEISVGNAVITMYGEHELTADAEKMFATMRDRNLVSWTAILPIRVKSGYKDGIIDGFSKMFELGLGFDSSCLSTVLDVCSQYKDYKIASQIHACVWKLGYASDDFVATALSDSYAKSGRAKEARAVFDSLLNPSIASFNVILDGSLETCGAEDDIMVLFSKLRSTGLKPDAITCTKLLCLSADRSLAAHGKAFHAYEIKAGFDEDIGVGNAVISMYGKCGCIGDSSAKFNEMIKRDIVTWNAIISAHAIHGEGLEALLLYENMIIERVQPDERTMVSILQACSYSGYLDYGIRIFQSLKENYGIKPALEHQVCLVDLLGRKGDLEQAMEFIKDSEFRDEPQLWRSLVNVCKFCGDLRLGKLASRRLIDLAPDDSASYILSANMYSESGMQEEAREMRVAMRERKLRKETGCSWISVGNKVHYFIAGGMDHFKSREIHESFLEFSRHLKEFEMCFCNNTTPP
ncbi:hypothetical protein M5K25_013225 [Dendrobium thyrsiflorum]|uniref:Pentatricopeptide repeat-containing protein n=1 Tax=Dendrobium thyrsiflorum TaxID=117978 RepID=A0ABD0UZA9_DENTH